MNKDLIFEGKKYISSKQASKLVAYTSDYVGQLCREGKLDARMVGRAWFISEESILNHKAINSDVESKTFTTVSAIPQFALPSSYVDTKISDTLAIASASSDDILNKFTDFSNIFFNKETVAISFLSLIIFVNIVFVKASFLPDLIPPINIAAISDIVRDATSASIINSSEINNQNTQKAIAYIKQSVNNISNKVSSLFYSPEESPEKSIEESIEEEKFAINSDDQGIVISPSTGSAAGDDVLKQNIRNSFSDEVEIRVDDSRSAGIITPVFKTATKDNYIYVMVPKIEEKK